MRHGRPRRSRVNSGTHKRAGFRSTGAVVEEEDAWVGPWRQDSTSITVESLPPRPIFVPWAAPCLTAHHVFGWPRWGGVWERWLEEPEDSGRVRSNGGQSGQERTGPSQ